MKSSKLTQLQRESRSRHGKLTRVILATAKEKGFDVKVAEIVEVEPEDIIGLPVIVGGKIADLEIESILRTKAIKNS